MNKNTKFKYNDAIFVLLSLNGNNYSIHFTVMAMPVFAGNCTNLTELPTSQKPGIFVCVFIYTNFFAVCFCVVTGNNNSRIA